MSAWCSSLGGLMQPGLLRPIPLWEGRPELLVRVVLCCPLPDELCLLPTLFFCASLSDVMISTRLPAVLCEAEQGLCCRRWSVGGCHPWVLGVVWVSSGEVTCSPWLGFQLSCGGLEGSEGCPQHLPCGAESHPVPKSCPWGHMASVQSLLLFFGPFYREITWWPRRGARP